MRSSSRLLVYPPTQSSRTALLPRRCVFHALRPRQEDIERVAPIATHLAQPLHSFFTTYELISVASPELMGCEAQRALNQTRFP